MIHGGLPKNSSGRGHWVMSVIGGMNYCQVTSDVLVPPQKKFLLKVYAYSHVSLQGEQFGRNVPSKEKCAVANQVCNFALLIWKLSFTNLRLNRSLGKKDGA